MKRLCRGLDLMCFLAGPSTARTQNDEFDDLRTKWKEMLTGGASFDPSDPQFANRIAAIDGEAGGNWSRLNTSPDRTYLWSDLASTTISSHITSSYNRLRPMSRAVETQ